MVIVEKDGKLLMVQEAQAKAYKKWNFPAGHLEDNEDIKSAAIREAKEESGYDIKLTGLLTVASPKLDHPLFIIFTGEVTGGEANADPAEILDVKWIPINEISKLDLRMKYAITGIVKKYQSGQIYPLDLIENDIYKYGGYQSE